MIHLEQHVLKRYKLVRSSLGPSRYGHLNCLDIKEKDGKLYFLQKSLQTLRIQNAYLFEYSSGIKLLTAFENNNDVHHLDHADWLRFEFSVFS